MLTKTQIEDKLHGIDLSPRDRLYIVSLIHGIQRGYSDEIKRLEGDLRLMQMDRDALASALETEQKVHERVLDHLAERYAIGLVKEIKEC